MNNLRLIVLGLIPYIALSTSSKFPCDAHNQVLYKGVCVAKSCYNDRLQNVILTDGSLQGTGGFLDQISYNVQQKVVNTETFYRVSIYYSEQGSKPLLGDPANCLDYRVYQTQNSYTIDKDRKYQAAPGAIPSWPITSKSNTAACSNNDDSDISDDKEDDNNNGNKNRNLSGNENDDGNDNDDNNEDDNQDFCGKSMIFFDITSNDLVARQCIKYLDEVDGFIVWSCYFELAFTIGSETIASYYFDAQIKIWTNTNTDSVEVNFNKLIEVDYCSGDLQHCQVEVRVASSLWFCDDEQCLVTTTTPQSSLYLNKQLCIKHTIDSLMFQTMYIKKGLLEIKSNVVQAYFGESEFDILKRQQGFNIYCFNVPIVATQVQLAAFGELSLTLNRLLLEGDQVDSIDNNQEVPPISKVKAQADLGEVKRQPIVQEPKPSQKSEKLQALIYNSSSQEKLKVTLLLLLIKLLL